MLTCGGWVKQGVAKEVPDKVGLEEGDLKQLVEDTKSKLKFIEGNEDLDLEDFSELPSGDDDEDEGEIENGLQKENGGVTGMNGDDDDDEAIRLEYGLDNYDKEGTVMTGAGLAGLMYFDSNEDDPYIDLKDLDEYDRDDTMIRCNDNLFVTGRMEEDYSSLDVYLYNEEEEDLFVHHDILLDSFPLCTEWMNFDPTTNGDPSANGSAGNFVAVGTMEPEIQVWDLDIIDTIEPAFVLGQKKQKKKKKKKKKKKPPEPPEEPTTLNGHTDAVLSLAWNRNVPKILASGSADTTVCLWDMELGTAVHSLKHHTDKVQSIMWHPVESESLLTGSFDKTAVVVDCRSPDVFKSWALSGECEQVLWDHFSPYNFFVSTDDGVVAYYDVRADIPVFKVDAHDKEVTGISLSKDISNFFTTVSADEMLKVWSYKQNKPECILSRDMKMGGINFISSCPDNSLTFAIGGQKDGVRMLNLLETAQGKEYFKEYVGSDQLKLLRNKEMGKKEMGKKPFSNRNEKGQGGKTMLQFYAENPDQGQGGKTMLQFYAENPDQNTQSGNQMETEHAAEALATLSIKKSSNNTGTVIIKRKKKKTR